MGVGTEHLMVQINDKVLQMFKFLNCNSGNPDNWPSDLLEPETRKEFDERADCIKKHMGRYTIMVKMPSVHFNSRIVLDDLENDPPPLKPECLISRPNN